MGPSRTDVEDFIDEWAAAERLCEAGQLEQMLDERFIAVGPKGLILNKSTWLDRYRSGAVRHEEFEVSVISVRHYGDASVAVVSQHQQSTNRGADATGRFRFTLILSSEGGSPLLCGLHVSPDLM